MAREFFAQGRDAFRCDRSAFVPPLLPNEREHVGDLGVTQCLVPRLHYGGTELRAFHCERALQTFQHDHAEPARAAIHVVRSGERWILTGHAHATHLMASRAVGRENFLAAIGLGKFLRLCAARPVLSRLWRTRRTAKRIKTIAAEVSRVAAEISAAAKDGESINRNEPKRERLEAHARLALFALNRGVHLIHLGRFAVIHSLPDAALWRGRALVHFASFAAAGDGDADAAGDEAGALGCGPTATFVSGRSCD